MAKNVGGSPFESSGLAALDQKLAMAKRCSHGIRMLHFLLSFFPLSFSPFSLGSRIKIDGLVDLID